MSSLLASLLPHNGQYSLIESRVRYRIAKAIPLLWAYSPWNMSGPDQAEFRHEQGHPASYFEGLRIHAALEAPRSDAGSASSVNGFRRLAGEVAEKEQMEPPAALLQNSTLAEVAAHKGPPSSPGIISASPVHESEDRTPAPEPPKPKRRSLSVPPTSSENDIGKQLYTAPNAPAPLNGAIRGRSPGRTSLRPDNFPVSATGLTPLRSADDESKLRNGHSPARQSRLFSRTNGVSFQLPSPPNHDGPGKHSSRLSIISASEPSFNAKEYLARVHGKSEDRWTLYRAARMMIHIRRMFRTITRNLPPYEYMCKSCKDLKLDQNRFLVPQHSADRRQQAYIALSAPSGRPSNTIGTSGLGTGNYELGTLRSIKKRAKDLCPFCKLVLQSLELPKMKSRQEENIKKCQRKIQFMYEERSRLSGMLKELLSTVKCEQKNYLEEKPPPRNFDQRRYSPQTDDGNEGDAQSRKTLNFLGKLDKLGKDIIETQNSIEQLKQRISAAESDHMKLQTEFFRFDKEISEAKCQASFQLDGREVEREASGEVISSRSRTRRIQLHWDHPELETSYIVLVAPEPGRSYDAGQRNLWESDTLFLGRSIRTASQNRVLVQSWVELCQKCHGKHCNKEPGEDFRCLMSKAFFGVIDVSAMRLTSLPPNSRYVALSYTWGHGSMYTTNARNIQLHQEGGGLGKQLKRLPKVIQDAIELVRSLGERYLWVDSLCIVQGNESSWNLNSAVMDLVYGHAYVTICAADGDGAETGLRGLDGSRVVSQHIEECAPGLQLTVSHLAEQYIQKSRWNTRGWTFQERLLSRRCIIFAGERIFFQCRSTALSEDIIGEQGTAGWSMEIVQAPLQMLLDIETKPFRVYADFARLYTKRNLGKRRDVLAAFQGISNLISRKIGAPLLFGLPTSHFDLALLWSPKRACRRRIPTEAERDQFGAMKFPSWSWCGWSDSAMEYSVDVVRGCLANVNQWLSEHTWIRWYIRDGQGDLRPIWSSSQTNAQHDIDSIATRWAGYGCNRNPKSDDYGRTVKKEYLEDQSQPLERSRFQRTLLEFPFGITETRIDSRDTQVFPDQSYLQFWTWSAHLRVAIRGPERSTAMTNGSEAGSDVSAMENEGGGGGGGSSSNSAHLLRCDIEDYCGDWCGTIVLNSEWLDEWAKKHQEEGSVHEFLALSEAKNFSTAESDVWTYYVPRERGQAEWTLFFVLLVTRDPRTGIYERQGLGKVFKEAFDKSFLPGKEWKEIILG